MAPQETNLYYLQSRYYDPEVGRFLNADVLVSSGQGILGNNMFAYCRNNPVRRVDISGTADAACVGNDDGELLSSDELESRGNGGTSMAHAGNAGNSANANNFTPTFTNNVVSTKSTNTPHNSSNTNTTKPSNTTLPKKGTTVSADELLDMAIKFLGKGYTEESPGRFVSSDKTRQVRMGAGELLGTHAGGPHVNFNLLSPSYKNVHVYYYD